MNPEKELYCICHALSAAMGFCFFTGITPWPDGTKVFAYIAAGESRFCGSGWTIGGKDEAYRRLLSNFAEKPVWTTRPWPYTRKISFPGAGSAEELVLKLEVYRAGT